MHRFYAYLIGLLSFFSAQAEIITDGSVGAILSLNGNMQVSADAGQQYHTNLFHSFSTFHIQADETAQFLATPDIENIIVRITGENPSHIYGKLSAPTHLYLFNPHGFLFTEQAKLDVQGHFHVSSSQQLDFADGGEYHTNLSKKTLLTSAAPQQFGFFNSQIILNNTQLIHNQAISLTAEHIELQNSLIQGAAINLTARTIQLENSRLSSDMLTTGQGGSIQLQAYDAIELSNSIISSSLGDLFHKAEGTGGQIVIETARLLLRQRSGLQTGAFPNTQGQAGDIYIKADYLTLQDLSSINSFSSSAAQGGEIQINAQHINLQHSLINASSANQGAAGNLQLNAQHLTLHHTSILSTAALQSGGGNISLNIEQQFLSLQSAVTAKAQGIHDGGNISIQKPNITVLDQTEILASAYAGHGGNIMLQTDFLLTSPHYLMDASSQLGIAGEIWLNHFEVDMNKAFHHLHDDYLQASNLLKQRCAAKFNIDMSSLTVKKYEVLPPMPIGIR